MIEIVDWNEIFETAATRKLVKMQWVQWPTGTDSAKHIALTSGAWAVDGMRMADGREIGGMPMSDRQASIGSPCPASSAAWWRICWPRIPGRCARRTVSR